MPPAFDRHRAGEVVADHVAAVIDAAAGDADELLPSCNAGRVAARLYVAVTTAAITQQS
jgi:hypothetical protein